MPPPNTPERLASIFEARTERADDGCLLWTGPLNKHGYAPVRVLGRTMLAHRVAYELENGPIPDGLDIDHVCHTTDPNCRGGVDCRHRRCLDPDHMESVTRAENSRRGGWRVSACRNGHLFDAANTYQDPHRNHRGCRKCNAAAVRKSKAKRLAA